MHKNNWLVRQFRGFSIIHWVIGVILSSASGIVWRYVLMTSDFQIIFITMVSFLTIITLISQWLNRPSKRGKEIQQTSRKLLSTIPDTVGEVEWNAWLLEAEAELRGKGLKRKSDILSSLVNRADPINKSKVAESFLKGLVYDAAANSLSSSSSSQT